MAVTNSKTMYYTSVGPLLKVFDVDVDGAQLQERGAVTLPANIQYAWPHKSRRYLYVVSSNGGPGTSGDKHFANAFAIDAATGTLHPHGEPAALPSRPIHASLDRSGAYLLTAYNDPSGLTVHRIGSDGAIGAAVDQEPGLDTGIYAHQILATPSNRCVVLVTRGNNSTANKPEDPGAIKTFAFDNGKLRNLASIAPGKGFGFGPRHLDFHPVKPWAFVSIERQNKLYVYALNEATGLSREPTVIKETLSDPKTPAAQGAGAIHVHTNGKFVYLTNRTFPAREGGREASLGGERQPCRLRDRSKQRRAETAAAHRRKGRAVAHFRHRRQRASPRSGQHHADAAQRSYDRAGGNDGISHRRGRHTRLCPQIRRERWNRAAILERDGRAALMQKSIRRKWRRGNDARPS